VVLSLMQDPDHPVVAAVLARVLEARIAYTTSPFRELGFSPAEARRRALLAVSAYLGHVYLTLATPQALPVGTRAERAYTQHAVQTLTAPLPRT